MAGKPWGGRFAGQNRPPRRGVHRIDLLRSSGSSSKISGVRSPTRGCSQRVGLLTVDECQQIERGLLEIQAEIEAGQFAFVLEREDIHMHIEAALIEKLGDVGPQAAHRAEPQRPGGDRVEALDPRGARPGRRGAWSACSGRWWTAAERHRGVILPGYTHMQRAQPVLAPHYFLAYVEKLERDRSRLADCRKRLNVLPLGAAALAGTSLPIDRDFVAPRAGLRRRGGQQPGCLQRPRLRGRVGLRADDDRRAPRRLGRGVGPLEHAGVRLPGLARRDLHGQQHHAAEEEPRRAGADPRPIGAGHRRPDDAPGADQGAAAGLQPRPAGGQGAAVRRLRHGRSRAWSWRPWWSRARASAPTGSPSGSTRASSTRRP